MFPRVDRSNCGYFDRDGGTPRSFYSSRYICRILNGQGWDEERGRQLFLRDITKTDLAEHHEGRETVYYRSDRSSPVVTVMGDIDAHHGQPDAWDAWEWLRARYLNGVYAEPSTGGQGVHFYLHLIRFLLNPRAWPTRCDRGS
jgi:hypothetical protein